MDVDLALSITKQQPFGCWGEWKLQTCVRLSAPFQPQPRQLIKEEIPAQSLFQSFTLENQVTWTESCSKFAIESSQLTWDFSIFSQQTYIRLIFQNHVELGQ